MKIGIKVAFSIAIIITVFSAGLLLSITQTRQAMIDETGKNAITFSRDILDRLDQRIFGAMNSLRIIAVDPEVKQLVIESNQEFDKIDDVDSYIAEKDVEWRSYAGKENPIFNEMVKNPLSQRLEELRQTFHKSSGVDIFPEIFVANKYGATIAENNRLTDWNQSDELQFQNTRDYGWHVSDLEFDKSAGVWSLEVAVAVEDGDEFAGMVKTAYNIEDIIQVFLDSTETSPYETARFAVFSGDNLVIHLHGTENVDIGTDVTNIVEFYDARNIPEGTYFGENPTTGKIAITAYSTSDGYRDFPGLNWIVGGTIDEEEFLAEVNQLQNILLGIMAISIIVGAGIGVVMIRGIVPPIRKIEKAAKEISNENFDEKVEIKTKDEFESLGKSINEMAAKLKQARKDKDEMVAMLTHDLKQPLTSILGNCDLLKQQLLGDLNEDQTKATEVINSNTIRLRSMIDNLITAQKLGLGALEFEIEKTSTKGILEENIATHSPIMSNKKIEYSDTSTEEFTVNTDKRRLLETFTNLIQNAVDFVPEEGGKIEIGAKDSDKQIVFYVKDNGEGMPEDKVGGLFQKYYQVKSKAKRKFGGTGLGLAVCKELVEGMKGKIWVESEEGKGTTFFFSMPKAD